MANRIPRHFNYLIVESLVENNAGKRGRFYKVTRDPFNGYLMVDLINGKRWAPFVAQLRNADLYRIRQIA